MTYLNPFSGDLLPNPPITSVNGLASLVRLGGYSVIGSRGQQTSLYKPNTAAGHYGQSTQMIAGLTYQQQDMSPVSVSVVKIVHTNIGSSGSVSADVASGELPPYGSLPITCDLVDLTNAGSYAVNWNGENIKEIGGGGIAISDPIPANIVAGQWFATATCVAPPKMTHQFNGRSGYSLTAGGVTIFSHCGAWPDDFTGGQLPGTGMVAPTAGGKSHDLILGYTGVNPTKTIANSGDSNNVPLGDGGCLDGGWVTRVCINNFNLSVTEANTVTPAYAGANLSKQGESLRGYATLAQHQVRAPIVALHTNDILTKIANDLIAGLSLATIKAAAIAIAVLHTNLGVNELVSTCPPMTNTTNGWINVAGQSTQSLETNRQAYNAFLRDASGAGFYALAVAAGAVGRLLHVIDMAAALEVNSSNVLTPGGNFMLAPAGAALHTGTVTTGSAGSGFTDNVLGAAANLYRGGVVTFSSATNAGNVAQAASISGQTSAGVVSFNKSFTNAITIGDAYSIWGLNGVNLTDTVHLSGSAQIILGQYFNANYANLLV